MSLRTRFFALTYNRQMAKVEKAGLGARRQDLLTQATGEVLEVGAGTGVNQPRALREVRRVLRPGGRLLFIEHVRSDDARVARRQDRMNGLNRFLAGCECNRSTLDTIRSAGYQVAESSTRRCPRCPPS
ncbi:MAG: class I SAM-dependent methyltransferase [Mycobacterium sp.]